MLVDHARPHKWTHGPSCSNDSAAPARASVAPCPSAIAALLVGEIREFATPVRQSNHKWKSLTAESAWNGLQQALVASNGPADLLVHTWDGQLPRRLVAALPVPPCASVCESYGEAYMQRILSNFSGFRLIGGHLRIRDARETPHIVDFFYKRYAGLRLLQHVERQRGRRYRAVVMARPDVVFVSRAAVTLPTALRARTVYVHHSDHRRDSSGTGAAVADDPIQRGLCGENPNDWFAFGDRESMGDYLAAFPSLPELHARMHRMPGGCDWWKCHNYKRNGTLLINAEAFLGIHLRTVGLGCEDVSASRDFRPPIAIELPRTRRRDWQSSAAHA